MFMYFRNRSSHPDLFRLAVLANDVESFYPVEDSESLCIQASLTATLILHSHLFGTYLHLYTLSVLVRCSLT